MILKLMLDDIKPRDDRTAVLARIIEFLDNLDPDDRADIMLTALRAS